MRAHRFAITCGVVAWGLLAPAAASGQLIDRLKDAAQRAAERETERKVEKVTADAVRCLLGDAACIRDAEAKGREVVVVDARGQVVDGGAPSGAAASPSPAGTGASSAPSSSSTAAAANYDFEPGERVLFREDFTADAPGDFPRRLELIQGNMQVVDWNGARWLRADSKNSRFAVALERDLPERFTIELDAHDANAAAGIAIALSEPPSFGFAWDHGYEHHYFNAGHRQGSGVWAARGTMVSTTQDGRIKEGVVPVRIMVDGAHAKMFLGENRVANVPRADLPRGRKIYFFLEPFTGKRFVYLTNLRIAAGGRDLYDAITSAGRVAVDDILFDTDRATIRPESESVLGEIGTMLREHAELSLLIEGHTDSSGDFDHNMTLSAERAAAVERYLVDRLGIDASRLRTMGLGSTRPVDSNVSEAGRQRNRRVELVKL